PVLVVERGEHLVHRALERGELVVARRNGDALAEGVPLRDRTERRVQACNTRAPATAHEVQQPPEYEQARCDREHLYDCHYEYRFSTNRSVAWCLFNKAP